MGSDCVSLELQRVFFFNHVKNNPVQKWYCRASVSRLSVGWWVGAIRVRKVPRVFEPREGIIIRHSCPLASNVDYFFCSQSLSNILYLIFFFINELDASTFLSWEMRILFGIIYFRTFTFLSGERWSQYIGRLLAIPESVPLMSREKDLEEGGGVATQEQSQIWFWKIIFWQWRDTVLQKIAKMEFLFLLPAESPESQFQIHFLAGSKVSLWICKSMRQMVSNPTSWSKYLSI